MKTNKAARVKTEVEIFNGNCLDFLKLCEDNSIDAVVTDPPYGLAFMNKKWDYDVPKVEVWREVLRVLKPGGHVLSFGGTRTYHRMASGIEDAGFEIRDQLQWLFGSGFPKSHNISKSIDKMAGAEREIVGENLNNRPSKRHGAAGFDSELAIGSQRQADLKITAPATDAAKLWDGWGSALKPANEPIVLARKPLEKGLTLAANVLKYGTGGLNIDASRIEAADQHVLDAAVKRMTGNEAVGWKNTSSEGIKPNSAQGRWPANLILDETAAEMLDAQSGKLNSGKPGIKTKGNDGAAYGAESRPPGTQMSGFGDSGGASRFFYVAKASKSERNAGLEGMPLVSKNHIASDTAGGGGWSADADKNPNLPRANHHPTVKPLRLMEYLCTLICPPNGTILDPFMGSGSTGVAAIRLGFNFIGCEMDSTYVEIAEKRIIGSD